jgi:CRP-like cAMP-binding protein
MHNETMFYDRSLHRLDLFNNMDFTEIEDILSHPSLIKRTIPGGTQIISTGDHIDSLMILIKGQMEGSFMAGDGRLLRLQRHNTPSLIAPACIFGETPISLNIRAMEESIILKINKEPFSHMLMTNKVLLNNFLKICSNRFILMSRKLNLLSFQSIRKKVALFLLDQMEIRGNPFILNMTLTDLAEYMGVERPSLSTVFNRMIKDDLFQKSGKEIFIRNRERVKQELD